MQSSKIETYVFDLDGTICEQTEGGFLNYVIARPIWAVIDVVRKLHGMGHRIVILTARGMGSLAKKNPWMSREDLVTTVDRKYRKLTEEWLRRHGVPYDELIFGKPSGDHYVDDKSLRPSTLVGMFSE